MGMQKNIADVLCAKRRLSGKSIETWAAELGISPSTLQDYLKGIGNPTIHMVEHLAEKLGVEPLALLSGDMEPEKYQIALLLLDSIKAISDLPQPKRLRFAELFLDLVQLWEVED